MKMTSSKLSQEERLRRKREAAKLRQRRCRAKKKREAELQKLRKCKSKSTTVPCKRNGSTIVTNGKNECAFSANSPIDLSGMTTTCSKQTKDFTVLTPCSSSDTPSKHNLVTPQGTSCIPAMPPLSRSSRIEEDRLIVTGTPPARIDEHELTAIDAILSLRRSPVTEPDDKLIPASPVSFSTGTTSNSFEEESQTGIHDFNATLPFLPEIKSPVSARLPVPVGCKSLPSTFLCHQPYVNYGLPRCAPSRTERSDLLMKNRCSLAPGVYFYYN